MPDAPRRRAGSRVAPALLAAYRAARYRVEVAPARFTLRIGRRSLALARLMRDRRARGCALLTAWNPRGRRRTLAANRAAQRALVEALHAAGIATWPARGLDPRGRWRAEESVLALDLAPAAARAFGRRHAQNAIVRVGTDAVPRLEPLR
jgi:hypothetical protein